MTRVETVDQYLAALPDEMRPPLESLRKVIRTAAPDAIEAISYQVPTYKYHGALVSFGAAKNHCAFYVMSPSVMEAHQEDLKGFDIAKGTVRFRPGEPLPDALVTKLVRARVEENLARKTK